MTRFLTPYDRELMRLFPAGYWKLGTWREGSGDVVPDLAQKGNGLTGTGAGSGVRTNSRAAVMPGDPHSLAFSHHDGSFRRPGTLNGWQANIGTIICWCRPWDMTTNVQGLFDTYPSGVGAMRIFTEDAWTTIRYDIGGSTLTGNFSVTTTRLGYSKNELNDAGRMMAITWGSGSPLAGWGISGDGPFLFIDGKHIAPNSGYASRDKTPACGNFDIGAFNNNLGRANIQSVAYLPRLTTPNEMQALYRAGAAQHLRLDRPALTLARR